MGSADCGGGYRHKTCDCWEGGCVFCSVGLLPSPSGGLLSPAFCKIWEGKSMEEWRGEAPEKAAVSRGGKKSSGHYLTNVTNVRIPTRCFPFCISHHISLPAATYDGDDTGGTGRSIGTHLFLASSSSPTSPAFYPT